METPRILIRGVSGVYLRMVQLEGFPRKASCWISAFSGLSGRKNPAEAPSAAYGAVRNRPSENRKIFAG